MTIAAVRYQYMPPLSPEEYSELEDSIRKFGVMVPILRDPNGVVIDGHHRLRIAQSLGVDCPAEILVGRSETDLRTFAFELNLNRRHLTREQRRQLVAESIKADPHLSSREHGRRAGVDHKTAETVRQALMSGGEIPHLGARTGTDGKSYPATPTRTPPRPALPPQFQSAVNAVTQAVGRIEKLQTDDRYRANRTAIGSLCLPEVRRAVEVLAGLLSDLGHEDGDPR